MRATLARAIVMRAVVVRVVVARAVVVRVVVARATVMRVVVPPGAAPAWSGAFVIWPRRFISGPRCPVLLTAGGGRNWTAGSAVRGRSWLQGWRLWSSPPWRSCCCWPSQRCWPAGQQQPRTWRRLRRQTPFAASPAASRAPLPPTWPPATRPRSSAAPRGTDKRLKCGPSSASARRWVKPPGVPGPDLRPRNGPALGLAVGVANTWGNAAGVANT